MPADGSPGAAWVRVFRARALRVPLSRASPRHSPGHRGDRLPDLRIGV